MKLAPQDYKAAFLIKNWEMEFTFGSILPSSASKEFNLPKARALVSNPNGAVYRRRKDNVHGYGLRRKKEDTGESAIQNESQRPVIHGLCQTLF